MEITDLSASILYEEANRVPRARQNVEEEKKICTPQWGCLQ
jgi:hypothetical protein